MKKRNREGVMLWFILPIIIFLFFGFWYAKNQYRTQFVPVVYVEQQEGVYDLSEVDFSKNFVCLQGGIQYIPELLSPEQYRQNLDKVTIGSPTEFAYATSYMKIKVPDQNIYMITTQSVNFAHAIYIGDELRYEAGTVANNPEEFESGHKQVELEVRPQEGYIEIYQQGANFAHRYNEGHGSLYIGSPAIIQRYIALAVGLEWVAVGIFFSLFFVHLILFIVRKNYPANLIFSLLCFTWMLRVGVIESKVFYSIFPNLSWQLAFRIEYMSLPIACILLVWMLKLVFDIIIPRWFVKTITVGSIMYILFCLSADTLIMSKSLIFFETFFIVGIVYIVFCFIRKTPEILKTKLFNIEQTISLIAYIIFVYATINDVLYYLKVGFPFNYTLTYIAMLIFSFFQMTAMFYGTMRETILAHEREQRALSETAMLQEMNRLKSSFYTEMTHEMKTPLTVIAINAQFAAQNIELGNIDHETVTDLNAVSAEAKRLAQMVTSLVGVGRMQGVSGDESPLDISTLLNETGRIYQSLFARKNNVLELEIDSMLPNVKGNADQLIQVLINLLANANRHTKNGRIYLKAYQQDNQVIVSVIDNGDGIPSDLLPNVFEKYSRGKGGGAGLGLAICKSIINDHGGTINIESEEGKGTCVWFTLNIKGEDQNES